MTSRYRVGALAVDPLRFGETLALLEHTPVSARPLDVHFCAAHAVVEARDDPRLAQAFHDAALVCPDGMPLVWVGRAAGRDVERVCGPDMMLALLDRSRAAERRRGSRRPRRRRGGRRHGAAHGNARSRGTAAAYRVRTRRSRVVRR